jgi:hypothetical protein
MRNPVYIFISVYFLIQLISCKSIEPLAPVEKIVEAPVAPQPTSRIVLPIQIKLAEYYTLADKQVPISFNGGESPCEGVAFNYYFNREPLKINAHNNEVKIDVKGKYWIKMSYCPSCTDLLSEKPICISPRIPFSCGIGEPMRRMSIQYTTKFEITEKYGLKTSTKLTDLKAIDPCEVSVFKYDATEELLKEVKTSLNDLALQIDKDFSAIQFKSQAKEAWDKLSNAYPIYGYGYLHLNPSKIMMLTPELNDNQLTSALILEANPLFDHNPFKEKIKNLPELAIVKTLPTDTFQLYIDFNLRYDSLSKTIQTLIGGKSIDLKGNKIIFDSIKIKGAASNELLFQLNFSGSKKGIMYLRGIPLFNNENQSIELASIDFDIETKNVLLKTAKWLFNDRILMEIQKASKQDLSKHLNELTTTINETLKYQIDQFKLEGKIHEMNVLEVYPNTDYIMIRVQSLGKINLTN